MLECKEDRRVGWHGLAWLETERRRERARWSFPEGKVSCAAVIGASKMKFCVKVQEQKLLLRRWKCALFRGRSVRGERRTTSIPIPSPKAEEFATAVPVHGVLVSSL